MQISPLVRYGLVYLISGLAGTGLCYLFTLANMYNFPSRPWGFVHLAILTEIILLENTDLYRLGHGWDLWDSYTWWWIYFLLFEWVGGKIIPSQLRTPISSVQFRYGRWGWLIFHAIVISTIFIFGVYVGKLIWGK